MKEKKKPTTKQLIVPAKYILNEVAEDPNTRYPLQIAVLAGNGSASYKVESKKELLGLCDSRFVYQSSLVRFSRHKDAIYMDLRKDGRLTIEIDQMPERRHMETLTRIQVADLYETLLSA